MCFARLYLLRLCVRHLRAMFLVSVQGKATISDMVEAHKNSRSRKCLGKWQVQRNFATAKCQVQLRKRENQAAIVWLASLCDVAR